MAHGRFQARRCDPFWSAVSKGGRSVIDACSFPMMQWAKKLLPGGLESYANVRALHDRLAADPGVKAAPTCEAGG